MCSPPLLTQVVATAADLGPSHPNLSAWVSLVATERGLGVMHITNEGRKLDITQVSSLLPKEPVKCSVDWGDDAACLIPLREGEASCASNTLIGLDRHVEVNFSGLARIQCTYWCGIPCLYPSGNIRYAVVVFFLLYIYIFFFLLDIDCHIFL